VADELETRLGFKRHRESVAAFARTHFPNLICQPEPRPKARRRWERSRIDELWQHDSSIHQWWPANEKQTLLLPSMIIPANSWAPSLSQPTPLGIISSIFAASFSSTAYRWLYTPTVLASLGMIPWPMTVIPVPSSNAPFPLSG
jgi:hypothetical protein